MPIEQKHYDRRGNYTGKTLTKTQREVDRENAENEELLKKIGLLIGIAVVGVLIVSVILFIRELLSSPAALSFPHNIFAYFYHFYFKALYSFFSVFAFIAIFLYKIPFEYLIFVKQITVYDNLNLILWIVLVFLYLYILFHFLFQTSLKVASKFNKVFFLDLAKIFGGVSLGPVLLWIVYAILEAVILWIFK